MVDSNQAVKHCFLIIQYLHKYDILKAYVLAKKLDVSTKQINRYVSALRSVGVYISSKSGKNGGYYLNDDKCPLCHREW